MKKCYPAAVNSAKMFLILILMLIGATPAFAGGNKCGDFKSCVKEAVNASVEDCEKKLQTADADLSAKPNASNYSNYERALKALDRSKANAKKVYGIIDNMKDQLDKEFDGVYEELKALRVIDDVHMEQIKKLLGRVGQIENVRLPVVEAQAARAEAKIDTALASIGSTQAELMLYSGTGISSLESGALIRYGSLSGAGYGWSSSLGFGLGDITSDPHATSVVTRSALSTTVGGPQSRLILDVGVTLGYAARKSISVDGGVVAGVNVGMRYRPSFGPIVFSAWAEEVWGRYEGKAYYVAIGIDPQRLIEAANK